MPEYKAIREIPRGDGTYIKAGETFNMERRDGIHWEEHGLAELISKSDGKKSVDTSGNHDKDQAEDSPEPAPVGTRKRSTL